MKHKTRILSDVTNILSLKQKLKNYEAIF